MKATQNYTVTEVESSLEFLTDLVAWCIPYRLRIRFHNLIKVKFAMF